MLLLAEIKSRNYSAKRSIVISAEINIKKLIRLLLKSN
jgi:hypothetical protein